MRLFIKHAFDPICVRRAVRVALIVGTVLALINHFDAIYHGNLSLTNIIQILTTYLIPYTVATHGSAMHARHHELQQRTSIMKAGDSIDQEKDSTEQYTHPGGGGDDGGIKDGGDLSREILTLKQHMDLFLKHARDPICMKRALKVALVVGTVIGLVNHFDEIINGTLSSTKYFQIGLTYTIPYIVNTFGSARQASHLELNTC